MLILASSSPRRKELLQSLGLSFRVEVKQVKEDVPTGLAPATVVETLALQKARAVAADQSQGLVIGADTIVVYNNEILGKPRDLQQAKVMLHKLQGHAHDVYSGVAVVDAATGREVVDHQRTKVFMQAMSEGDIARYVATGEPLDKAGAYAIQGIASIFIEKIEGCYFNVVGLPLNCLTHLLKKMDYHVLANIEPNFS